MIKAKRTSVTIFLLIVLFGSLVSTGVLYANNRNPVNLEVFPNPVLTDNFSIKSDVEISEVIILNVLGKQVFNREFAGKTNIYIHLETRDSGLFILQVKTVDGRVTTKRVLFK
jgi:hypothetical protein